MTWYGHVSLSSFKKPFFHGNNQVPCEIYWVFSCLPWVLNRFDRFEHCNPTQADRYWPFAKTRQNVAKSVEMPREPTDNSRWFQNDPTWDETPKRIVVHSKKRMYINCFLTLFWQLAENDGFRLPGLPQWPDDTAPKAKRLENCWMDGDLSKHKWMVLLVKFWFPAFQACLLSGHCSLIDAFVCILRWQNLSFASVYTSFLGKKRKKLRKITPSLTYLSRFGHLPGSKKKAVKSLRKKAQFFSRGFIWPDLPGSRVSWWSKGCTLSFQKCHVLSLPIPNWTRKTWSVKKRPDFWTLCDMYWTSRCWPSVVSFHTARGLIFHQLLTWNIWKHPVLCHCQGLHVCSPNQIRHSAWNNLYIRTSNLIT